MSYGLYQNVSIYFDITDNLDLVPVLRLPNILYSNAKMTGTHVVKYYTLGTNIIKSTAFLKKYGFMSTMKPRTDHVLLLSVSSSLGTNGNNILRHKNRTFIVFPIELTSIRHNNEIYPNPGSTFNPDDFHIKSVMIDVYTNKVQVQAQTEAGRSFRETTKSVVTAVKLIYQPILEELRRTNDTVLMKAYETKEGKEGVAEFLISLLNHANIFLPAAKDVRQFIIATLQSADSSDNEGRNPTHYYPFKDGPDKDLWWSDRTDFEVKMRVNEDNLELVKKNRREHLRLEQVLSIPLANGERARAITWDEVKANPDWILDNEDAEVCLFQWGSEASKQMCAKAEQIWKNAQQRQAQSPTDEGEDNDDLEYDAEKGVFVKRKSAAEMMAEHMNDNELENLK